MGRRGMPGRRRHVLQLDENTKTSYLTQTGCYRPDDMFVESKNSVKTGLALVGEYSDSESDSEEEQTDPDVESKINGDTVVKSEESQLVKEKNDSLQAEMLELVGIKKETSADIFLREFQAYQKESVAPVYNREFIAFQKESKENIESSPISSLKDAQKENPTKSSEDASSVTKIDKTSSSGLKTPDIDSQVASFLAEIDALGDDEEKEKVEVSNETGISDRGSSVDQEQNVQSSTTLCDSKNKDPLNGNSATTSTSKTAKEEEENVVAVQPPPLPQEEKIVWPDEPTTEWQQCYDENTQHCYYWNINTNEVTWEIPAEFTQYLLLYREYEEKITKLMKEGKTKPKKKKTHKKSEKSKVKQNENESETSSKDSNVEPQVEYGPHLPSSSNNSISSSNNNNNNNHKDTCSSPETAGPTTVSQESSKESMEPIYGPMMKPDTVPEEIKEKGEESDASNSSSAGKCMHNTTGDNAEEEVEEEEEDNNSITDNKKPPAASATSVTDTSSPVDSTAAVTVNTTTVNEDSTRDSLTADLAMMELCKKKFKARISREEESGKSSVSLSVDSSTKDNSLPTDFEEGLLDIDEVDRELELALERKKNELKCLEEEEKQSYESVKVHGKRKYHNDKASDDSSTDEVSPQKSSKRSRDQRSRDHKESSKQSKKVKHKKDEANGISSDDSSPLGTSSKKSRSSDQKKSHRSHQSKKESRPKKTKDHGDSKSRSCDDAEENKIKESALDLSQVVMDKMDFLEIDVSKQSKLQVLYVQLKTRISDWHAGGLSTKYFYAKLQEANQQLGQYEKSGAPAGWSVNWDRTCKRYFYTNNNTGHSQWEYPDQPSKEEENELPDNFESVAGSLPLPLLPPPPPPSSSPSSLEKTREVSVEADKEHQKVAKEYERRDKSSEKEKYSSSKSEGRKEKRSRKESKSKSSRSKDSSKSKSRSENSSCSKLKDYGCEMNVYPGEPPPPGTEPNLQSSVPTVSSVSVGETNSPQMDNKNPLKLTQTVEDDLEDVMQLAASLNKPVTVRTSASGATDDIDDKEIDPEDEVAAAAAAATATLLPSGDFKINSSNTGNNGTTVSMQDAVGSHNTSSSAVISKPPHITRPALSAESLPVSTVLESTLTYSGHMETTVSDVPSMSHLAISSLSELPNDSSNSPKLTDNNEATETIKNPKEKKKKKDKVITSLTLKKKNVSSLVQKWQKVKKEVEKEDELARHEFSDGD